MRPPLRASAERGEIIFEMISFGHLESERGRQASPNKRSHDRPRWSLAFLRQRCLQSVVTHLKWLCREMSAQKVVTKHSLVTKTHCF